jgi:hypothetical protein
MKKEHFILPGYLVGISSLGLITYRTLLAVGTEGKAITVTVNHYGEQYLDVVMLAFLWVFCIIGVLCLLSQGKEQQTRASEDHERPQHAHQIVPLGVPRSPLGDKAPEIPAGVLRAPTTEITERFPMLETVPAPLDPSDEKKGSIR